MKTTELRLIIAALLMMVVFTACKKDAKIATDTPQNTLTDTKELAQQIEKRVADFKKKYLVQKNGVEEDDPAMQVAEAIEMIETDLNYTYAETNVSKGIVNEQFGHSFAVNLPISGEFSGSEIYNIYHEALDAIIATNNELTDENKQLTWVDMELAVGEDGNNEIIVTYLFAIGGPLYYGPDPEYTFNYSGWWHWFDGSPTTGLGYFSTYNLPTPDAGVIGGARGQLQAAAQFNFNQKQWHNLLIGYYVGNTTLTSINLTSSPYYTNPQLFAWLTLTYPNAPQNNYAINTSASTSANIYPEAVYRAQFQEPAATAGFPSNGYYWLFERECFPDIAMNFYSDRIVDLAYDIMPSTGILTSNQGVYTFSIDGLQTNSAIQGNPQNPIDLVQLTHSINLNIGTYVASGPQRFVAALPNQ